MMLVGALLALFWCLIAILGGLGAVVFIVGMGRS